MLRRRIEETHGPEYLQEGRLGAEGAHEILSCLFQCGPFSSVQKNPCNQTARAFVQITGFRILRSRIPGAWAREERGRRRSLNGTNGSFG